MNDIIFPSTTSWYNMVSPRIWEMPDFLKLAGTGWRTPQRKWEMLWRERRGDFNHILGKRRFKSPKFQRGMLHPIGFWGSGGGPSVQLTNITHSQSAVAPTPARIHIAYNTNGQIYWDSYTGVVDNCVYAQLTTDSNDTNDHTAEWWSSNPSAGQGSNWDLMYSNVTETGDGFVFYFRELSGIDRTISTWYSINTVWADVADGTNPGALVVGRINGTAKNPLTGTYNLTIDIDIRATGTGGSVAQHTLDLTAIGT